MNKFMTWEQYESFEPTVGYIEDCGMSGEYVGYHWFTLVTDQEEINIYVK